MYEYVSLILISCVYSYYCEHAQIMLIYLLTYVSSHGGGRNHHVDVNGLSDCDRDRNFNLADERDHASPSSEECSSKSG